MQKYHKTVHEGFRQVGKATGRLEVDLLEPLMARGRIMDGFEAVQFSEAIDLATSCVQTFWMASLESEEDEHALAAVLIAFMSLFGLSDRLAAFQGYHRDVQHAICGLLDEVSNLSPKTNILQFAVNRMRLYVQITPFARTKQAPAGWCEVEFDFGRYGDRRYCLSILPEESVHDYMLPVRLWRRQHRPLAIAVWRKLLGNKPLSAFFEMISFPGDMLLPEDDNGDRFTIRGMADLEEYGRESMMAELARELERTLLELEKHIV